MALPAGEQKTLSAAAPSQSALVPRASSDAAFIFALIVIAALYVGLILAMLLADVAYLRPADQR
jgi:hypothetical protein